MKGRLAASSARPAESVAAVWLWYEWSVLALQSALGLPSQSTSRSALKKTAFFSLQTSIVPLPPASLA
jgi:hypothetical protein